MPTWLLRQVRVLMCSDCLAPLSRALSWRITVDSRLRQVWANIRAMTWPELTTLALIGVWTWPPTPYVDVGSCGCRFMWMSVTPGLSFGRAMIMTRSATAVTNTVPTVGPAIGVGLTSQMPGKWGSLRSRRGRHVAGGPAAECSSLDNALASQQGRRVGPSWPARRAMDPPVDESTSAATQWLQQVPKQRAGGRLGPDLGGS